MKRKAQSQSLSCDSVNAAALTYLDIGALSHERVLQTKVQVGLTVQGGREVKDVHWRVFWECRKEKENGQRTLTSEFCRTIGFYSNAEEKWMPVSLYFEHATQVSVCLRVPTSCLSSCSSHSSSICISLLCFCSVSSTCARSCSHGGLLSCPRPCADTRTHPCIQPNWVLF